MTAPAQAISTRRGRFYEWKGEQYLSVTNAMSVLSKYLVPWAAETAGLWIWDNRQVLDVLTREDFVTVVRSKPFQKRDEAAVRGSDVHAAIAAYGAGRTIDLLPAIAPYVEQFERWRAAYHPDFIETEITVYHPDAESPYAGTLDAIVRLGDKAVLVDYKTANEVGKGPYDEVALQLAAYRHARFIGREDGTEEPMPRVDACAVLQLWPTDYTFREVEADEDAYWAFLNAVQSWLYREGKGKTAIRDPWPKNGRVAA